MPSDSFTLLILICTIQGLFLVLRLDTPRYLEVALPFLLTDLYLRTFSDSISASVATRCIHTDHMRGHYVGKATRFNS